MLRIGGGGGVPDEESPGSRSDVRFLSIVVDGRGRRYGVYV